MKNLKYIILFVLILSTKAFSQATREQKEKLYIMFSDNDKNKFMSNDSGVLRTFYLDFGKFTDKSGKIIELKIDRNNNLEKINWIRGSTNTPPTIIFYYYSNDITRNEKEKVDIKNLKNFLEEDETIKYVEFNNLKAILSEFNLYAVQKEGNKYFAYKVQYGIQ